MAVSFRPSGIVTLLTDFGLKDTYVGQMKGVILALAPMLRIVDLTHEVAPQEIDEGAFLLGAAVDAFPAGTVYLAVVDPGVGTARRALCVVSGAAGFIGPDNGLFSRILPAASAAYEIVNPDLLRQTMTATFHGRDVFAPVAARLAGGLIAPADVGPEIDPATCIQLEPTVRSEPGEVSGRVVSIDRFGNCITAIAPDQISALGTPVEIQAREFEVDSIGRTFADVATGEPIALIGSAGTLELVVRDGNAAERYGLTRGEWVKVRSFNSGVGNDRESR